MVVPSKIMSTENHTEPDRCIDYDPDSAVDVALDVSLELADDPKVREYIRRAQMTRVARRDLEDGGSE